MLRMIQDVDLSVFRGYFLLIVLQVAPKEVLPIEETKQNPYAVLCTTTMGGHLSWFEWGGGRWYVKPVGPSV